VLSALSPEPAQVRPGVMGRVQVLEPGSLALADNGGDLKVQRGRCKRQNGLGEAG
jgi:hypothetical protein